MAYGRSTVNYKLLRHLNPQPCVYAYLGWRVRTGGHILGDYMYCYWLRG